MKRIRWIPNKKRLPPHNKWVLATDGKTVGVVIYRYRDDGIFPRSIVEGFHEDDSDWTEENDNSATHWAPLPDPVEKKIKK